MTALIGMLASDQEVAGLADALNERGIETSPSSLCPPPKP